MPSVVGELTKGAVFDVLVDGESCGGGTTDQALLSNGTVGQWTTLTEAHISDLTHTDAVAIHDNVASEISAVTEKVSPVNADLVLIEDSADSNAKKRVQVGNLPGGGGGTTSFARTFALMGA